MARKSGRYGIPAAPVILLAYLLNIAITTLVLVWLLHVREGLAFTSANKSKIFNLHPLLMIIGFLLIVGNAIMAYKAVPAERRIQKAVHGTLHIMALASGIFGVYTAFKFHHEINHPHMFTLHSWLGIITISLFALQWIVGFWCYVFPGAEMSVRGSHLPWHRLSGLCMFLLGICTAETGFVQKFISLGLFRSSEALLLNFTALLLLLFAFCVGLTVVLPRSY